MEKPQTQRVATERRFSAAADSNGARTGKSTSFLAESIGDSPRMTFQRKQLSTLFGFTPSPPIAVAQRQVTGTRYHTTIEFIKQKVDGEHGTGWCYAAVSAIVRRKFGESALTVRDVVKEYLVSTGADAEILNALPDTEFDEEFGEQFGVEQLANKNEQPVTADRLKDMLGAEVPAIVAVAAHSYVAHSFDTSTNQVVMWDPLAEKNNSWDLRELIELFHATIINALE
jgi:hypothetical protein